MLLSCIASDASSANSPDGAWAHRKHQRNDTQSSFQIPLPPLEVQKEIVAEIEGYQKVIDGARAVLDHYRPHIPIHPDWPITNLATFASQLQTAIISHPQSRPMACHS